MDAEHRLVAPSAILPFLLLLVLAPAQAAEPSVDAATGPAPGMAADAAWERGRAALERGDFGQAAVAFSKAVDGFHAAGRTGQETRALLRLADAQLAIGSYRDSLVTLERALPLAEAANDAPAVAAAHSGLGNAHLALRSRKRSRHHLEAGLAAAREAGSPGVLAALLNNLANHLEVTAPGEALETFDQAANAAQRAGSLELEATARANAGRFAVIAGDFAAAEKQLGLARARAKVLPNTHRKAFLLVQIGRSYARLAERVPERSSAMRRSSFEALDSASELADGLPAPRAASYALGYLGNLYECEGRTKEALQLTRRAIFTAQEAGAPEALYLWQWQTGRLLQASGKPDAAVAFYREAVGTLQAIRPELATAYGDEGRSFRNSMGTLYFELVDLLLRAEEKATDATAKQALLFEARATVERFKVAELRDYFRDECVDAIEAKAKRLDVVSESSVVVYPLVLPDRTELLLSHVQGIRRVSVAIGGAALTNEIHTLRHLLEKRTTREFLPSAQKLYDWLIRPAEAEFAALGADTLVFVPDGPLRTVPMAALHDGKQFLIERYAVATTPGLSLTDPRPLERERLKLLLSGLSESVQGYPALKHVSSELSAIQELYGGDLLLNGDFLVSRFESSLRDEQFSVVHIASHGQFEGEVDESFVLTYDGKLSIDRLGDYVGLFRFRDQPLELLTLSACDTAAGDDRAALGLAGIAVRAGARSALGTLWTVDDRAASQLVVEFYRQLQNEEVSRAMALQRAQRQLILDARYWHPGYWSPFILINNWL